MNFKNIRAKLKDEKFLLKRLGQWADKEKDLDKFRKFQCSEFFEGKTNAQINQLKYDREMRVVYRKLSQFKRRLENLGITIK